MTNWHALSTSNVLNILKTSIKGLSNNELIDRYSIYGKNVIKRTRKTSILKKISRQFNNILIYVLLASAIIALGLQKWADSSVIFSVVFINAVIGYMQEGKAEKAIEAISAILSPRSTVIRDNKKHVIDSKNLVPGDIVFVGMGDKVSADIRLIKANNLQAQESILTGESFPITKTTKTTKINTPLENRYCMLYSGTTIVSGLGIGVVVETGIKTEIGKITKTLEHVKKIETPLIKKINLLGKKLTSIILVAATITFCIGFFIWDIDFEPMFMAIVGLVVAAIPEGLPAIVTITLAIGVTRMAKKNTIVRRLPAVEIMGGVSTICTDKTGTLTHNELSVQNIISPKKTYHFDYLEKFEKPVLKEKNPLSLFYNHSDLTQIVLACLICNDAEVYEETHQQLTTTKFFGDPIDTALLKLATDYHNIIKERQKCRKIDIIPFDSKNKMMATLHYDHEKTGYIFIKGAPEKIFSYCKNLDDSWIEKLNALANNGNRVIAIAYKKTSQNKDSLNINDIDQQFELLGLIGLIDPPREEAKDAIAECHKAGISVKMITGDHTLTAKEIASQVGIDTSAGTLSGTDIDALSDQELEKVVTKINVFSRTAPSHKIKLVQALQKNGQIVAMTGDGVNDSPALKQANIGIAMGEKGTEAAKESAEIVLTNDNFKTIRDAVQEGRTVYDNIKKALLYILPTNIAESFILVISILFNTILPISAIQILWVNMATTVTLSLAISFEKAEKNIMKRPPYKQSESKLLSKTSLWKGIFVGMLFVISAFILFHIERSTNASLTQTRTAVLNMLVMAEAVYLINSRKFTESMFSIKNIISNPIAIIGIVTVIILQLTVTYTPSLQSILETADIGLTTWLRITILSIAIFTLIEIEKFFSNMIKRKKK